MRLAQGSVAPAANAAPTETPGFQPGASIGVGEITSEQDAEGPAMQRLTLRVPLMVRPQTKIDVRDMVIQVLFYDTLDDKKDVRTNANVSSRWATSPPDWNGDETEVLEVEYHQAAPDPKAATKENRKYACYIVRVYYKDELQAARAAPPRLAQQFPAPQFLEKDAPTQ